MSRLRHTRRRTHRLGKFLLFCVLCAVFFWWSNHSLQTERAVFTSPRLPAGFDGCTIVQLSDLHGAEFGEDNEELIRRVREAEPDYIFLTGDLLDRYRQTPRSYAVSLGKSLAGIAPTYFVTGNHEWAFPDIRTLKRELRDAGVTVLSNEYVPLSRGGGPLPFGGNGDPHRRPGPKNPRGLGRPLRGGGAGGFWGVLGPRGNSFLKEVRLLGAGLGFARHGDGGLIRLPFTDGLVSVERSLFPSYTAGFYEANGGKVFVSRGLGNSGRTFRLFNRPEMVVLTLRCQ